MWIETVRNSRLGTSQQGKVVERLKKAQQEENLRLSKIKAQGVDARWTTPAKIKLQQGQLADMKKLKALLENKLVFSSM